MSEITAQRKFPCPACGAEAEWNPTKQKLVCPFCGSESAADIKSDGTLVEENDLMAALSALPGDQRGWDSEKKTVRCQNCNAISVFDATRVAQRCDFCGSPSLIPVENQDAPIRPSGLLPFAFPESKVRESMRVWFGSHWFAPGALGQKALTDTVKGLYIPYWTFDAHASAQWTAEAGYHYTETDSEGRSQQRTRWQYASGSVENFFDDVLVPASKGVRRTLLAELEPFPTTSEIKPYDPAYLSGWVAEQYQIDLPAAAQDSRNRMDGELRRMCIQQIPGDTYRSLNVASDFSAQTFKHVLLPVWLATYNYGARNFQVTVNGFTGKVAGEYPLSWIKVTLAVIAAIIVLIIVLKLQEHR